MKARLHWLVLLCASVALGAVSSAQAGARTAPWPESVVERFGELPVQDGGRVKPISTFADFTLLRLSGRRSLEVDGQRLSATEWMLDALFYPEAAESYPLFLVEHPAAIDALGMARGTKEIRDRYSLLELRPGLQRLFELAHAYASIEDSQRSAVQRQVGRLAEGVHTFLALTRTESLAIAPPIESPDGLAGTDGETWSTPAEILERGLRELPVPTEHKAILGALRAMGVTRDDPALFGRELASLHELVVGLATGRGEYEHITLERAYYRWKPLTWGLAAFLAAFLTTAVLWLRPTSRALRRVALVLAGTGAGCSIAAIVIRCVIRGRPPVSTLYETVLFVTAVGVLLALFIELVDRRRVALSAAAIFGAVGLFIANGYETLDARDTMPSLVAVLDTNFWLATHVTAITIGYSAGMLAALFGTTYVVLELLPNKRRDRALLRRVSRTTYGILCFSLLFSVVGTLLGGIWANESWGRFWGWDPKENGALLICLAQIAILHARRGGFLRDRGVCLAAAFAGTIVAFSWWGVNLLGVGLHSYGFTSGIHTTLWTYYTGQWAVVLVGLVTAFRARAAARRAESGGSSPEAPASSDSLQSAA